MARQRESWGEVFRAAGDAFLDVLRAELAVVAEHWKESGLRVGVIAGLAGFSFFLLFWLAGLLTMGFVDLLRSLFSWQLWQAAFAAALGILLLVTILMLVAWFVARRLENPVGVIQLRLADHRDWWQTTVMGKEHQLAASTAEGPQARSSGDDDEIQG